MITIGNKAYKLVLTVRATKEIVKRFGGLENLGEELSKGNFEESIDDLVWLIVLLANQGIMIQNIQNGEKTPLLTAEEVELFTSPKDLTGFNVAITEALHEGVRMEIESEKNAPKPTENR